MELGNLTVDVLTVKSIYAALAPGDEVTLGSRRYVIENKDGNRVGVYKPKRTRRSKKAGSDGASNA